MFYADIILNGLHSRELWVSVPAPTVSTRSSPCTHHAHSHCICFSYVYPVAWVCIRSISHSLVYICLDWIHATYIAFLGMRYKGGGLCETPLRYSISLQRCGWGSVGYIWALQSILMISHVRLMSFELGIVGRLQAISVPSNHFVQKEAWLERGRKGGRLSGW